MCLGQLHPYPLSLSRCRFAPASARWGKKGKSLPASNSSLGNLQPLLGESNISLKKGPGGEEATTAP